MFEINYSLWHSIEYIYPITLIGKAISKKID